MSHEISLNQAAEMAHQAEVVSRMLELYPNDMDGADISAVAQLLKCLTGNVAVWLIEEQAQREGNQ